MKSESEGPKETVKTPIVAKSAHKSLLPQKLSSTPKRTKTVAHVAPPNPAHTKMIVPAQKKAEVIYKEMKTKDFDPISVDRIENADIRKRGNLRPLRKASHSPVFDCMTETETETETEEEEGTGEDSVKEKDDVVHCTCGSELDEGFMIQVE